MSHVRCAVIARMSSLYCAMTDCTLCGSLSLSLSISLPPPSLSLSLPLNHASRRVPQCATSHVSVQPPLTPTHSPLLHPPPHTATSLSHTPVHIHRLRYFHNPFLQGAAKAGQQFRRCENTFYRKRTRFVSLTNEARAVTRCGKKRKESGWHRR